MLTFHALALSCASLDPAYNQFYLWEALLSSKHACAGQSALGSACTLIKELRTQSTDLEFFGMIQQKHPCNQDTSGLIIS
jgi:hypothetical protein